MNLKLILALAASGLALSACIRPEVVVNEMDGPCETGTFQGAHDGEVILPQNWTCQERQEFWFTDQGSQIIPYTWFLHLERVSSEEKFRAAGNVDRYRYLPQQPTQMNPDGLPIGLQIVGPMRCDQLVLDVAAQFEAATQVGLRRPTL